MEHVEVRHAHLLSWSLLQVGVVLLAAFVIVALVVGLMIWRRGR